MSNKVVNEIQWPRKLSVPEQSLLNARYENAYKFVHHNGLVGHIEDIVTHSNYRGHNLGKIVIETLKYIGEQTGCYKIILDCSEKNVPFYVKCGFAQKEFEMAYYIPGNDVPNPKAKL